MSHHGKPTPPVPTQTAIPASLYHDFLTVTFGVLVTEGLIDLSKLAATDGLTKQKLLLFCGVFVFAFHLWMTSIAADHNSSELYQDVARSQSGDGAQILNGLLLLDAATALVFAAFLLIMFKSLENNPAVLYASLFWLAITSLAYDVYAAVLYGLSNYKSRSYEMLLVWWTVLDVVFVLCAYLLRTYGVPVGTWSASSFLALALCTLILDVVILNAERYKGL